MQREPLTWSFVRGGIENGSRASCARAAQWRVALGRLGRAVLAGMCLPLGAADGDAQPASRPGATANASFVIDAWTTENGLPQNEVTSILQGRAGHLWLGTHSGLVRFDGLEFTVFDESTSPGLRTSRILSLFEDSQTNLWIGTGNAGVALAHRGEVVNLGIGGRTRGDHLAAACEDPSGAVWLYLANGELWRWSRGATNCFRAAADQVTDYRGLALEPAGPLWVGTDQQLIAVDWRAAHSATALPVLQTIATGTKLDLIVPSQSGGCWRLANRLVQKWQANPQRLELDFGWYPWDLWARRVGRMIAVSAACEDLEGNLIVGTLGAGVYWFNAKGAWTQIVSGQNGLPNDYVSALHVDGEGDLWVGTDGGGLSRVKKPIFDLLEVSRGAVVQAVSADDRGGVWIGYNGKPLEYWLEGAVRQLPSPVRTILVDREQRVWAGMWGAGLLQVLTNRFREVPGFDRSFGYVSALHQDRRGWLWVGSQTGLARWDGQTWTGFTTQDGLSANAIQSIADDLEGSVWIGTESGGLNRWQAGTFAIFRRTPDGLPSDNVSSLYADSDGVLWVGTDGGGLARFHQGRWARYTRKDGLISNRIGYLVEDSQRYLWIGSTAGLMRASKQDLNAFANGTTHFIPGRVFGKPDGLPIRECSFGTQPGPCRTPDGKLWFPTIQGLAAIDPAVLKPNPPPPPVRVEAVFIDGQPQHKDSLNLREANPFVVPAGKQHIEIHYSSLSLAAPDRTRFKYRLEGHENEWVDAGSSRVARYSGKLPPAQYQFHVIACNEHGVWNEVGATLAFTITPPFWRTWWFMSAVGAGLLGGVAGTVHHLSTKKWQQQVARLRQQEALEKERTRIARDIHDQLGASLTQVALLGELVESDKETPAEVEIHARQISQTARDTTRVLDEIVWAVNPSNDTLEGLMTYLCKHTQEYLTVAGLHYRLDVPERLPVLPLPPEVRHNVFLACKEAVTNVVRHARASEVWIRLRLECGRFVLEVEDDGIGLGHLDPKAALTRNGLRNMRERMEEVGGEFSFAPGAKNGTLIRLTIRVVEPNSNANRRLDR